MQELVYKLVPGLQAREEENQIAFARMNCKDHDEGVKKEIADNEVI